MYSSYSLTLVANIFPVNKQLFIRSCMCGEWLVNAAWLTHKHSVEGHDEVPNIRIAL